MSSDNLNDGERSRSCERAHAPVFVLGCPRSGTTLLYHMLLSAGGFAVYRTESNVFNVLRPLFGNLEKPKNRQRLMDVWTQSKLFERSGLDRNEIRVKIVAECRSWGDFLDMVMLEISRRQNVERWADCTPDHLLYIPEIKRAFPNALVIHIIRDGRDVALSLAKQPWIRPLFRHKQSRLLAAGLYWEWAVKKGRQLGRAIPADYFEVRFEDLVQAPFSTLKEISTFIQQDLEYEKILETAIGSVNRPNTSFATDSGASGFSPVGRWQTALCLEERKELEEILGGTLRELGYISSPCAPRRGALIAGISRMYHAVFGTKLWMKRHTPLGRLLIKPDLSWL